MIPLICHTFYGSASYKVRIFYYGCLYINNSPVTRIRTSQETTALQKKIKIFTTKGISTTDRVYIIPAFIQSRNIYWYMIQRSIKKPSKSESYESPRKQH